MMLKISAVSYLNTRPFLYGLQHPAIKDKIQISLDNPAQAAEKLLSGEADISLVPVAIIPQLENPKIISPYCIGADGSVATVALFSNVPIEEIKTVYLDYQSRTSVQLARVLFREYWKRGVIFAQAHPGFESELQGNTAGVIIGDRAIHFLQKYPFVYDLSEAWKNFTGLPFVFAVWLSKKNIDKDFIAGFNTALKYGLDHTAAVIEQNRHFDRVNFSVETYLKKNIQYELDTEKRKALMQFLGYMCADDRCKIPNVEFVF